MKTLILKSVLVAAFATTSLVGFAKEKEVLNTSPISIQSAEDKLIEEVLQNEIEENAFIDSFDSEPSIFIYDMAGNLVFEAKMKDPQIRKVKKLINQSDLVAEIDGSQYYLLSK